MLASRLASRGKRDKTAVHRSSKPRPWGCPLLPRFSALLPPTTLPRNPQRIAVLPAIRMAHGWHHFCAARNGGTEKKELDGIMAVIWMSCLVFPAIRPCYTRFGERMVAVKLGRRHHRLRPTARTAGWRAETPRTGLESSRGHNPTLRTTLQVSITMIITSGNLYCTKVGRTASRPRCLISIAGISDRIMNNLPKMDGSQLSPRCPTCITQAVQPRDAGEVLGPQPSVGIAMLYSEVDVTTIPSSGTTLDTKLLANNYVQRHRTVACSHR